MYAQQTNATSQSVLSTDTVIKITHFYWLYTSLILIPRCEFKVMTEGTYRVWNIFVLFLYFGSFNRQFLKLLKWFMFLSKLFLLRCILHYVHFFGGLLVPPDLPGVWCHYMTQKCLNVFFIFYYYYLIYWYCNNFVLLVFTEGNGCIDEWMNECIIRIGTFLPV